GNIIEFQSRSLLALGLSHNKLDGQIPRSIFELENLDYLDLSSNQLSGNIIEFQSRSLSWLYLHDNKLDGLIPRSIFELEKVTELDLSSNNLSGTVEFGSKLQSLRELNLSFNHLSLSFNHLRNNTWPQLELLYLSSCNISEFPYFLRAAPNLHTLSLSHNRIQANIPKWLLDLGKDSLGYLDLSHNSLTGTVGPLRRAPIPSPSTSYFFISNNQFTGEIPPTICSLSSLQILDLSNNKLSGKIHQCIGNFSQSLSVLNLRNNKFHGVIPGTFSEGNVLRNLDLNENQLEGSLPQSLLRCRELEVLDLGNNKIQDTFPNWLESLPKLQVLILRSNKFSGEICFPKTKFPFQKMHIIDLSNNRFSGLLPTKYFENLTAMINSQEHGLKYMGGRYYQDTVVVTIKGFEIEMKKILTYFTIIDFSNNTFRGEISSVISTIPPSFGEMSNLEWLDLSSNKLVGDIPEQLTNLTSLSKFNVSKNQLVGPIPHGKQFDTFDNDSYSGNTGLCGLPLSKTCGPHQSSPQDGDLEHENGFDWKVVLMGYASGVVIGISIGYLVLSNRTPDWLVKVAGIKSVRGCNTFRGEISSVRDFSNNTFRGEISSVISTIPPSFGEMSNLEWLDLSSNKLVGDIPEQLANLTSLSKFNVSKNQLVGPYLMASNLIHLKNDSYSGNTGLCGLQLSKTCGPHQSSPQDGDLEHENGFDWKVVLMGYASGVVIGISVGYLVLSNRTPDWFVKVAGIK
ncbi:receptor like protein 34, partial [Prunus dulcis]